MNFKYCLLYAGLTIAFACTSEQPETDNKTPAISQKETSSKQAENEVTDTAVTPQPTAQKSEPLIVPGKSVGLIKLNEAAEVVQKLLGKPTSANAGMGKSLQTWALKTREGQPYQLSIFFSRNMGKEDEKSRAKQIRVTQAAYRSDSNAVATKWLYQNNINQAEKTASYTAPAAKEQVYIFDNVKAGIAFEKDQTGIPIAITVHEPGKAAFEVFTEIGTDLKKVAPAK